MTPDDFLANLRRRRLAAEVTKAGSFRHTGRLTAEELECASEHGEAKIVAAMKGKHPSRHAIPLSPAQYRALGCERMPNGAWTHPEHGDLEIYSKEEFDLLVKQAKERERQLRIERHRLRRNRPVDGYAGPRYVFTRNGIYKTN